MIVPNASITSYARRTGVDASAEPVLAVVAVTAGLEPRCRLVDPAWRREQSPEAESTRRQRIVMVSRGELASIGVDPPEVGDRIGVRPAMAAATAVFVIDERIEGGTLGMEASAESWRLTVSPV